MRIILALCLLLGLAMTFVVVGYQGSTTVMTDLQAAEEAARQNDWAQASRLLQRYLREEDNAEKRWEAWILMVKSSGHLEEGGWTVNYLETMLQEYADVPSKLPIIYRGLGQAYEVQREWEKASQAWMKLMDVEELSPDATAKLYRRMGRFSYQAHNFALAEDMLEMCLSLGTEKQVIGECHYYLAESYSAEDKLEESIAQIEAALPLLDESLQGQAYFLKGDVLEQMGKNAESQQAFQAALPLHPNQRAVQSRLH